ncbi:hypothetical protein DPMN_170775 [Dreissena polymorpha]|uniref:Uncharacterized protein n=1 Tax=Dreissena polymorpha TaxID=45954 RepID=A0A9D4IBU4_DREPO|nr:hypothetical protein DPMN_170775 [Dreissena polymorpha]
MKTDVLLHVKRCDTCAANKKPIKTPRAPMCSITTGAPFDVLATDYLGPLPLTERGDRYIQSFLPLAEKSVYHQSWCAQQHATTTLLHRMEIMLTGCGQDFKCTSGSTGSPWDRCQAQQSNL